MLPNAPLRLTCHCTSSSFILTASESSSDLTHYSQEIFTNLDTSEALTFYRHPATSETLYFCSVCGARLSIQDTSGQIKPLIGCLEPASEVTTVLKLGAGKIPVKEALQDEDNYKDSELPGRCLCGAVTFTILRPPEDYHNDPVLKEWIKPKLVTTLCFCYSCRATTGAPYWNWAFIPRSLVRMVSTSTLREYKSTDKVTRRFCGECGETCFYEHAEAGDGEMWDVAFDTLVFAARREKEWFCGLFDERMPVKKVDRYVEGWMEGRCSFQDEGVEFLGREVVEGVVERWRERWIHGAKSDG